MFVIIPLIAFGSCICMYCAYTTWTAAKLYHLQAESMIRMANERLYEADKIWQRMRQQNNDKRPLAKVLPFTRPLKSVPMPPEDNGPNNAA